MAPAATPRRRAVGEGSIYFDADKDRWVGALVIEGRRRKVIARTKTEARQRLDALRREVDAGTTAAGHGNITIGEILTTWERRALGARTMSPSTRDGYRWAIERLSAEIGSRRARALTVEQLEQTWDTLANELGRSSLIKLRSVLGQALDFAMRRGTVTRNVAKIAELSPEAKRTKRRRALDADEARTLVAALEHERLGPMFIIMTTVGIRPGEAAGLCWDDLDLDAGLMAVRRAVRLENGRPVLVEELKTDRSRRTITLPTIAVDALRRHRHDQITERVAARQWADDRLVFATTEGTALDPANVRRELARISTGAGLDVLKPNELRHTAASLLSASGVPLEHVADVLGHTNTRMLEATYRHAVQPSITAAAAPMDRLLGSG